MRRIRGNEISMVFQEPMASLSPVYTVANQLVEAIQVHLPMSKEDAWKRGIQLLERVGIPRPERTMEQLSVPAVRRHVPAGDDRHRACPASRDC